VWTLLVRRANLKKKTGMSIRKKEERSGRAKGGGSETKPGGAETDSHGRVTNLPRRGFQRRYERRRRGGLVGQKREGFDRSRM